jgi:hypothetical protein
LCASLPYLKKFQKDFIFIYLLLLTCFFLHRCLGSYTCNSFGQTPPLHRMHEIRRSFLWKVIPLSRLKCYMLIWNTFYGSQTVSLSMSTGTINGTNQNGGSLVTKNRKSTNQLFHMIYNCIYFTGWVLYDTAFISFG